MYVKSNTVVGDQKHTTGVVLAEIVMGNIPVKNGVIHLIHRPLMVVDTTVAKFLEVCRNVTFVNRLGYTLLYQTILWILINILVLWRCWMWAFYLAACIVANFFVILSSELSLWCWGFWDSLKSISQQPNRSSILWSIRANCVPRRRHYFVSPKLPNSFRDLIVSCTKI